MQKIYLSEEKQKHRMRLYKQGLTDSEGKADNQVWLSPQEFIKAWQGGFKYSGNCESQKKVGWWA